MHWFRPRPRRVVHLLLGLGILFFAGTMLHQLRDLEQHLNADAVQHVADGTYVNAPEPDVIGPTVVVHSTKHPAQELKNASKPPEELVYFKKDLPLIWIGGVPRSGTTLMRAMLDAHVDIRCGEETRVIPRLLGMHSGIEKSNLEMSRLHEAKIDTDVLNSALGAYLLSIIAKHGEPAPYLCNKDPFTLRSMSRILKIFPQSKFLLMIRDGRATVHSIISRKVSIKGFDTSSYRGALLNWNKAITNMYTDCMLYGETICLPVYYEQLVLHPEAQMRNILKFLNISWDESVLHHELTIGTKTGVSLSKTELSTDQVNKPINTGALVSWAEHIPYDVRIDIDNIAPMLKTLGYDSHAYPPFYGTPDQQVAENSRHLMNK